MWGESMRRGCDGCSLQSTPSPAITQASKAAAKAAAKAERTEVLKLCAQHSSVLHSHGGLRMDKVAEAHLANRYPPLFIPSAQLLDQICSFFGLASDFPRVRLVARSPNARSLLLLSDACFDLLNRDVGGKLRVVNTGGPRTALSLDPH